METMKHKNSLEEVNKLLKIILVQTKLKPPKKNKVQLSKMVILLKVLTLRVSYKQKI